MMRIGRLGHADCAPVFPDAAHNTATEPVTNVRRVSFFIFLPVFTFFIRPAVKTERESEMAHHPSLARSMSCRGNVVQVNPVKGQADISAHRTASAPDQNRCDDRSGLMRRSTSMVCERLSFHDVENTLSPDHRQVPLPPMLPQGTRFES